MACRALFACLLPCLGLLAPACASDPDVDGPLDTSDATDSGGAQSAGGTEGAGSTEGAEGTESATGAENPGGSGGAEGESGGADGESGGPDPALCDAEGDADASFSIDTDHWPNGEEFEVDFDVQCEVLDMGEADGVTIEPTLECDLDGTPQTVTITMADPQAQTPDGQPLVPAFGVGLPVRLRHSGVQDAGGLVGDDAGPQHAHLLLEQFSMHGDDGHLLAAGFRSWSLPEQMYAPVSIEEQDELCGVLMDPSDPNLPMGMTFTLDGASLDLVSGHAGLLDTTGSGEGLWIAAETAEAVSCCHSTRDYALLFVDLVQGS